MYPFRLHLVDCYNGRGGGESSDFWIYFWNEFLNQIPCDLCFQTNLVTQDQHYLQNQVGQLEDNAVKRKERLAALKRKLAGEVFFHLYNIIAIRIASIEIIIIIFVLAIIARVPPRVKMVLPSCQRLFSEVISRMQNNSRVS